MRNKSNTHVPGNHLVTDRVDSVDWIIDLLERDCMPLETILLRDFILAPEFTVDTVQLRCNAFLCYFVECEKKPCDT